MGRVRIPHGVSANRPLDRRSLYFSLILPSRGLRGIPRLAYTPSRSLETCACIYFRLGRAHPIGPSLVVSGVCRNCIYTGLDNREFLRCDKLLETTVPYNTIHPSRILPSHFSFLCRFSSLQRASQHPEAPRRNRNSYYNPPYDTGRLSVTVLTNTRLFFQLLPRNLASLNCR